VRDEGVGRLATVVRGDGYACGESAVMGADWGEWRFLSVEGGHKRLVETKCIHIIGNMRCGRQRCGCAVQL